MMDNIDLGTLSIREIREALASHRYSAEALTLAALAQVKAMNPEYNAIIFENEAAIDTARDIDRRILAGESVGPLAGVPVVVKDPMDMAGFPTTAGWSKLNSSKGGVDLLPERDSPVVARMRQADAVILGKTNVPILSLSGTHANDSWAGPTINPVHKQRVPGGSSAGTAAAVATHMVVVGLAEETGGSIQNPASAQGLVGIKPTVGLVPNAGVVPLSANRDVVGPIARTVEDAAHCLDVLAGYSSEDPKTLCCIDKIPSAGYAADLSIKSLNGKRLGLYGPGWRPDALSTETIRLYERAKTELVNAGAQLVDDPFDGTDFSSHRQMALRTMPIDARGLESIAYDMTCYLRRLGQGAALKTWEEFAEATDLHELPGDVNPMDLLSNLPDFVEAMKSPGTPPAMPQFIELKRRYLELIAEVFARHELDGLVYPQMTEELPELHSGKVIRETTVDELNIAGIPAVTVPAGYYESGAPFELIFLGLQWSEQTLVQLAYAYEQCTLHRRPAVYPGGA